MLSVNCKVDIVALTQRSPICAPNAKHAARLNAANKKINKIEGIQTQCGPTQDSSNSQRIAAKLPQHYGDPSKRLPTSEKSTSLTGLLPVPRMVDWLSRSS